MYLAIIVVALLLSAFFSGSEIAFITASRLRVEVLARKHQRVGKIVAGFLADPGRYLTTTLVGNNLALVVYSTMMAIALEQPLQYVLGEKIGLGHTSLEIAALTAQTLIATTVVLLFGEILPKSIMREIPNRAVYAFAVPLRITYYVLLPLVKLAGWASSILVSLLGVKTDSVRKMVRTDFINILKESKVSGGLALDADESALLENVFAMDSVLVKASMVPRTEIHAVELGTSISELRDRFIEAGNSKLPVYRENIDNIEGVVFAYDLFHNPASMQDMIRPISVVPETKKSKDLLAEMRKDNTSIAIVVDEYGGTAGLVTIEDLLEELFGEIQDEFDQDDHILRQTGDNSWLVSGRVELDELKDKFDVVLPDGEYETVAGFLIETLGTIPGPNDEVELSGYRFVIVQAAANRVDLVRIIRRPAP